MINDGFIGNEEGVRFRYPELLADALAARPGDHHFEIVDLGSAAGAIGSWLANRDARFRVTGLDRDERLVGDANILAERGGMMRYVLGDVERRLPFAEGSIDGVVMHRLRDSVVAPERRSSLTAEIARIVRPEGFVSLLEDMRVDPAEPHGDWYAERYGVHRRVLEQLMATDPRSRALLAEYEEWLSDPDAALLMSLRAPDGSTLDDLAWLGREKHLAAAIGDGHVRLRGVGIHQSAERVQADFANRGLVARATWRVEIPEPAPRLGHATVMKGFLLQRVDRTEAR